MNDLINGTQDKDLMRSLGAIQSSCRIFSAKQTSHSQSLVKSREG